MSSGLNVNSYSSMPAVSKNAALKSFNNVQNVSFRAQSQPAQDIYQTQDSKPKSSKAFWVVFTLATGAALAAIAYHYRGKSPSAKETSAVTQTVETAVSSAADKTEGAADTSGKKSLVQILKDKFKAIKEEMKEGFDEYGPVSGPQPKNHKLILNDKVNEMLAVINGETPSIAKASDDVEEFARLSRQASSSAFNTLNNNREMDSWIRKTINDFSAAPSSSLKRTGFGKSNAFIRTGADSWIYTESYSDSLRKTTSKAKKRITVNADEMTVAVDNVKNTKKNVETAKEVIKYNGTTGEVKHYKNYKLTPDGIEYSQGVTMPAGASAPEKYIEGYKELADGTIKMKMHIENDSAGRYGTYSENVVKFTDGSEECSKITVQDINSGEFVHSAIGYKKHNDGAIEYAKEFDPFFGIYREEVKILSDGKETAAKVINFDADKNPISLEYKVKINPSGTRKSDIRIEYKPGTNEPKYYYENYKYDEATGRTTYRLKAQFKKGKWIKVG